MLLGAIGTKRGNFCSKGLDRVASLLQHTYFYLSLKLCNTSKIAAHVQILTSIMNICFQCIYLSRAGPVLVISAGVVKMIWYGQYLGTRAD